MKFRFFFISLIIKVVILALFISSIKTQSDSIEVVFSFIINSSSSPKFYKDFEKIDLFEEIWETSKSELTSVGERQAIIQGFFNKDYLYKDFISSLSYKNVKFYSVDSKKTISTAYSYQLGMFPHSFGRQITSDENVKNLDLPPIPIPTIEEKKKELGLNSLPKKTYIKEVSVYNMKDFLYVISFPDDENKELLNECSYISKYIEENILNEDLNKEISNFRIKHEQKLKQALSLEGISNEEISFLSEVYIDDYNDSRKFDVLRKEYDDNGIEELYNDFLRLYNIKQLEGVYKLKKNEYNNGVNDVIRLSSSKVFDYISKTIKDYIEKSKTTKSNSNRMFFIYSLEPKHVSGILNFIHLLIKTKLEYSKYSLLNSSQVDIILKYNSLTSQYYIGIYFNSVPILENIVYSSFLDMIKDNIYSNEEISSFCKEEIKKNNSSSKGYLLYIVIGLGVFNGILIFLIAMWYIKKMDYYEVYVQDEEENENENEEKEDNSQNYQKNEEKGMEI